MQLLKSTFYLGINSCSFHFSRFQSSISSCFALSILFFFAWSFMANDQNGCWSQMISHNQIFIAANQSDGLKVLLFTRMQFNFPAQPLKSNCITQKMKRSVWKFPIDFPSMQCSIHWLYIQFNISNETMKLFNWILLSPLISVHY